MFTREEHWKFFPEFVRWEKASGGPDPQLAMVGEMTRHMSEIDRVWASFCYIAVYNVPFGEVFWRELPWSKASNMDYGDFYHWLEPKFNDKRIVTRFERRCVRRVDWMAEYMAGAVRMTKDWERFAHECRHVAHTSGHHAAYECAWKWSNSAPRIGRYVALKHVEWLRRYLDIPIATPDIRPHGAWSPRKTMGILLGDESMSNKDNSPAALHHANEGCHELLRRLSGDHGIHIDLFELQVVLCEYRESFEGKRQYPGRSLDSELGYVRQAEEMWGPSKIWETRKKIFPAQHLGELHDWDGPRKDVALALPVHRYTWSDLVYDYTLTKDIAKPVRRQ